jgi:Uroporphyrinogen decarboxylase (URO-D)
MISAKVYQSFALDNFNHIKQLIINTRITNMKLKWLKHSDLAIKKTPCITRDEYLDHMTFKSNKRALYTEIFGPIVGLKEEWEAQGATPEELDFSAFEYRAPMIHGVQVNTGFMLPPTKVIEETDQHIISIDGLGRRLRLEKGYATIPLPENFPVNNMNDWLKIKPYCEFSEERFGENWLENAQAARDAGHAISIAIPGGFDAPRQLFGEEMICYAVYDHPEVIHDILNTIADTALKVFERVTSEIQVDILGVHEDMAGKSGPLWGPDQIREFIKPYYLKCWNFLRDRGARIFDQDSDGDMNPVIDAFLECGLNSMYPMEPGSNMDIVKIRAKHGNKLAFYGGLDKYALMGTKEQILAELEYKVPPMVASGGCVLALDHRIPNGVPLENYKYYLAKLQEIIAREEMKL